MTAGAVHVEVLFAVGYVAFLVLVAWGFGLMARSSHNRILQSRTVGFRFHRHLNVWECSQGTMLGLMEVNRERGVARYKAEGRVCNRCSIKHLCTDSEDGRELTHTIGYWTQSELGRFQGGLSVTLLVLGEVIVVIELARHHSGADLVLLGLGGSVVLSIGMRVLRAFTAAVTRSPAS
ncbi:MAG: hypothetical protein WB699_01390 [Bacteroidota bacterium]